MKFETLYQPYCSSWLKFGGAIVSELILYPIVMAFENNTHVGLPIINIAYHAHNLYAEYQYNKSLEAELKVEINGEIHTVKASPSYFNWYTAYNALSAVSQIIGISLFKAGQELDRLRQQVKQHERGRVLLDDEEIVDVEQRISELSKVLVPIIVGSSVAMVFKLISLKDNYVQYNFTDKETGISISPQAMEYVKILDVKYINVQDEPYSESLIDNPISCAHIHELGIYNPVMEAAA